MSLATVPFQSITWKTLLFHLVAFPVAIFYFTLAAVGITLSIGLLVVVVGFFLGYGVLWLLHGIAPLEGWLVTRLLGTTVVASLPDPQGSFIEKYKKMLSSSATWSRIGYIPLKFVTAIAGFTVAVTALGSVGLIAAPLFYQQDWFEISVMPSMVVDTLGEAVLTSLVGLVLAWVMLYLSNLLGRLVAYLAHAMVSDPTGAVL